MGNHVMNIDFFGNNIRCETDGLMVSLTDLSRAGSLWRLQNDMAAYQLHTFIKSATLTNYVKAAAKVWGVPEADFIQSCGRGKTARTMAHISVAVLLAEQISPIFHAEVHKLFLESKLLEFRALGATEFTSLNKAIDAYLPGREGKTSNKGVFIQVAKLLRSNILGSGAVTSDWNLASSGQTHMRYQKEKELVSFLTNGLISDYTHLKSVI